MNSLDNELLLKRLKNKSKTLKEMLITLYFYRKFFYYNKPLVDSVLAQVKSLICDSETALQFLDFAIKHHLSDNEIKESWNLVEKFTKSFDQWVIVRNSDFVPKNRQVEALQYLRETAKTFDDYIYLLKVVPKSEKPLVLAKIKRFRKKEHLMTMIKNKLFSGDDYLDILRRLQVNNKSDIDSQLYVYECSYGELEMASWEALVAIVSKL